MKVLLAGAAGNIGRAIGTELRSRGHQVVGLTRSGKAPDGLAIPVTAGDVTDAATVAEVAAGVDAVISAVGPGHGDVTGNPYLGAQEALTRALPKAGVSRLLVVGGAGSLRDASGQRLVDSPHFPAAWKPDALRQAEALDAYRGVDDLEWTYVSPAAVIGPGSAPARTAEAAIKWWSMTKERAESATPTTRSPWWTSWSRETRCGNGSQLRTDPRSAGNLRRWQQHLQQPPWLPEVSTPSTSIAFSWSTSERSTPS